MNWKNYKETPDEGMYEAIQRRLRVRRAWRISGMAVAVVAVAAVVAAIAINAQKEEAVVTGVTENRLSQEVQEPVTNQALQETAAVAAADEERHTKQSDNVQAEALLPEMQMRVVDVAEPVDEKQTTVASLAEPAVAPRQTKVKDATARRSAEPTEVAENERVNIMQDTKLGGGETPTPYHEDNLLWAPNIITPNGEKPENRVFKVVATSDLQDFRMHIYNRGGRLVYRTSDINSVWDATHGGSLVPQGAYVWVAIFRDSEGVQRRETGTVTVVR